MHAEHASRPRARYARCNRLTTATHLPDRLLVLRPSTAPHHACYKWCGSPASHNPDCTVAKVCDIALVSPHDGGLPSQLSAPSRITIKTSQKWLHVNDMFVGNVTTRSTIRTPPCMAFTAGMSQTASAQQPYGRPFPGIASLQQRTKKSLSASLLCVVEP